MPVTLPSPVTLRTISASSWAIQSIHFENLTDNNTAFCVFDVVLFDQSGVVVETRRVEMGIMELVTKYPAVYAGLKSACYAEAQAAGLPEGTLV